MFKEWLSFFKMLVPGGFSLTNRHLHTLDGHGSHVTIEAIEEAQTFGLDIITLCSHTNYALKPLDVVCFKPFKTTLKKKML